MARAVRGFDPDAPDDTVGGDGWDVPAWSDGARPERHGPGTEAPDGGWVDPFDELHGETDTWVDPIDDPAMDTPAARADRAYGAAVDPASPTEVLRRAAADLAAWDVDALLAEAAIMADVDARPDPPPSERPDVQVLRSLLRHPNRPADLADVLLAGWLEDPGTRSPWPPVVALAQDGEVDDDLLVTAVTEALDAARSDLPPDWSLVLTAVAAARPGGGAALDLLAMVPFPHDDPTRLWPDAERAAKGLPGGVRARAKAGAEALGWDGRRHPGLVQAVVAEVHRLDQQARRSSFADHIEVCPHGPVTVTPSAVSLPATTRGERPYVARIVGSHPVFRLKRDWPDRDDGPTGTAWTWAGAEVLEARGLGCDACRAEPDKGKRYLVSTGDQVAPLRLRTLQRVLDQLDEHPGR